MWTRRPSREAQDGSYETDARLDLEDFAEQTGIQLLAVRSGRRCGYTWRACRLVDWACAAAGRNRQPRTFEFEVLEADPRRIKRLRCALPHSRPPADVMVPSRWLRSTRPAAGLRISCGTTRRAAVWALLCDAGRAPRLALLLSASFPCCCFVGDSGAAAGRRERTSRPCLGSSPAQGGLTVSGSFSAGFIGSRPLSGRPAAARLADTVCRAAISGRACAIRRASPAPSLPYFGAPVRPARLRVHGCVYFRRMAARAYLHRFPLEPAGLWLGCLACRPAERGRFLGSTDYHCSRSFWVLLLHCSADRNARPSFRIVLSFVFMGLWLGGLVRLSFSPTQYVPGVRLRIVQPNVAEVGKPRQLFVRVCILTKPG